MTDNHPITPSPELVREWAQVNGEKDMERFWLRLAAQAARWGADQELGACCELLDTNGCPGTWIDTLRAARRPKPPSLAARALHILGSNGDLSPAEHSKIRRALEQLND